MGWKRSYVRSVLMKTPWTMCSILAAALLFSAGVAAADDDTYRNPAGKTAPGLERQGHVPPGQAKKMYDDRRDHRYDRDQDHRYDRDRDHRYDRDRDRRYDRDNYQKKDQYERERDRADRDYYRDDNKRHDKREDRRDDRRDDRDKRYDRDQRHDRDRDRRGDGTRN